MKKGENPATIEKETAPTEIKRVTLLPKAYIVSNKPKVICACTFCAVDVQAKQHHSSVCVR